MDKISRIVPGSARTKSAEVAEAQPARPGAPAMGRPMGRVTESGLDVEDRVTLSAAEKVDPQPALYKKTDATRAKVVDEMAKKFFDAKATRDFVGKTQPLSAEAAVHGGAIIPDEE